MPTSRAAPPSVQPKICSYHLHRHSSRPIGWVALVLPEPILPIACLPSPVSDTSCFSSIQYGLKKKEEKEAEEKAALEQPCEGSLTRPKKAIPAGCGDDEDEDEESILDTVLKYLPGPLQDMFKK